MWQTSIEKFWTTFSSNSRVSRGDVIVTSRTITSATVIIIPKMWYVLSVTLWLLADCHFVTSLLTQDG